MSTRFKRISVIGLGYIGLPTAAVIASRGIEVIGVDVNERVVETINQGKIHIVEPDLDMVVQAAVKTGHLRATTKPEKADAFLVAVPTPFKGDNHEPGLSYIEAASKAIAPVLEKGNLVILESTSPVGATEQMARWIAESRPDLNIAGVSDTQPNIYIAHCPERVLPGKVLQELVDNDRTIGGITEHCAEAAKQLYEVFVRGECVTTDVRTAEMCKLTENAFRDVNIAFANELSLICEKLGIDVWGLIKLANRHPRVNILQPGPGVGGHCIAVDPWFIVSSAPAEAKLIRAAREVNDGKPNFVLEKVRSAVRALHKNKLKVVVFGLTFKADIDDCRESPALTICRLLGYEEGLFVDVIDPNVSKLPDEISQFKKKDLADVTDSLSEYDICLILVDHKEFKEFFKKNGRVVEPLVIDTRGLLAN